VDGAEKLDLAASTAVHDAAMLELLFEHPRVLLPGCQVFSFRSRISPEKSPEIFERNASLFTGNHRMSNIMTLLVEDPIPTRYSLLSRLEDRGDNDSWKDFFDIYWRLIYSVAIKSGLTEAEAEEVVQETIISVAHDIHKFKRDRTLGSFKGWLRNIIRWRIADQLRKRTRASWGDASKTGADQPRRDVAEIPDQAIDGAESVWEAEWQANLLQAAMEAIKPRIKEEHYQIFNLYVIKQWPVMNVARALGVNVGLVYLVKYRVSALLKKEIRRLEEKWSRF
jgi:RNA polymerase sigma-70 factor (ECF subfamily)